MPAPAPADFATFALAYHGRRVLIVYQDTASPTGERSVIGVIESVGAETVSVRDSAARLRMVRLDRVLTMEDRTHASSRTRDHARA